ncbi:hypothetical protein ACSBR1_036202 [Camellia fascicularis]
MDDTEEIEVVDQHPIPTSNAASHIRLRSVVRKDFRKVKTDGKDWAICNICKSKLSTKKFVSGIQPMFKMVSRNTIKKDIFKVYDIEREKMYSLLEKIESRVAITTDMWTSKPNKRDFVAIRHISLMKNGHCENIDRKLSTTTVDNATTNDAMIPTVLGKPSISSLLLRACVLDPRYKMKVVEYDFPIIYGENASYQIEKIRQDCYDLLHEYQSRLERNQPSTMGGDKSACQVTDVDGHDPLSSYDLFVNLSTNSMLVISELDFYLEENVLPRNPNFDVLSWWKTNGVKFPTLQKIVWDILAIPVSTVTSESSFSTSTSSTAVSPNPPKFCDEEEADENAD